MRLRNSHQPAPATNSLTDLTLTFVYKLEYEFINESGQNNPLSSRVCTCSQTHGLLAALNKIMA